MTIRFCFWCGTGYNRDSWNNIDFECTECNSIFTPPEHKGKGQLSLIEAIQSFSIKPLTDKKAKQAAKRNAKIKKIK